MKFARTCIALAAIIAPGSFSGQTTPQPSQSEIGSADRLFQAGKFADAGKLYSQIATQNPKDYSATLQLGRIALLANRLDDAQKWLEKAIALKPGDKLEENKASKGAVGGGKLKIVPYTVHQLSFGVIKENNVPGLYDGPFSWENMFGFHLAGMVGHDFFKSYAVTFDFENMQIIP
jgi:tetratricopeptide (TPR) repeat protein